MYHYAVCLENGWGVKKDMVKVICIFLSVFFLSALIHKQVCVFCVCVFLYVCICM